MVPQQLKIFVYVIGLETSFSVTIKRSETVDDLKELILKRNSNDLKGVDSRRLTIYKVQVPDSKMLGQLVIQAAKEELLPSALLSRIFPASPPVGTISILVKVRNIGKNESLWVPPPLRPTSTNLLPRSSCPPSLPSPMT